MKYSRKDPRLNDYADLISITLQDILNTDTKTEGFVLSVIPSGNENISVKIAKKEYNFTLKELKPAAKSCKNFLKLITTRTGLNY